VSPDEHRDDPVETLGRPTTGCERRVEEFVFRQRTLGASLGLDHDEEAAVVAARRNDHIGLPIRFGVGASCHT
jgi:hypothetical protein